MRTQIYKKEEMIHEACNIVLEGGFEKLTARKLADNLNCSTQPIYLQYKNMHDLKNSVIDVLWNRMVKKCNRIARSLVLNDDIEYENYVRFTAALVKISLKNRDIYRALWIDEKGDSVYLFQLFEELYVGQLFNIPEFASLSKVDKKKLHFKLMMAVQGLILIQFSGVRVFSDVELVGLISQFIDDFRMDDSVDYSTGLYNIKIDM